MPNGATHARIHNMGWLVAIPASLFSLVSDYRLGLGIFFGYALGLFLDPDLDQQSITMAEGRVMKLGIFAWPWLAWWMGYSMLFKHRSFWSHFPYISTFIRLLWLLFLPYLFIYYKIPDGFDGAMRFLYSNWMIGIFYGLGFADLLHYLADLLGDALKNMFGGWFYVNDSRRKKYS